MGEREAFDSAFREKREAQRVAEVAGYRATLDLLPDEIALAIGLHVYDEGTLADHHTCVCGWVVREALAREANRDPEEIGSSETAQWSGGFALARRFGGDYDEWRSIFNGVCHDDAPLIEEALFDRVMAAVENSSSPTRKAKEGRGKNG